MKHNIR